MKTNTFICVLTIFSTLTIRAQEICPIIPTPSFYEIKTHSFHLLNDLRVNAIEADLSSYRFLENELNRYHDIRTIPYVTGYEIGGTRRTGLDFIRDSSIQSNGYELEVNNFGIKIRFSDDAGCFAGVVSLLQLVASRDEKGRIQGCIIKDSPKYEWRGLHLDVSRHFYTVEEVKRFIDLMSLYKFNKFHWHLTDDQGWRIEIKKYPKLTSIGAFRDSTIIGHYTDKPRKYDGIRYGGFYTQEQVREIIKYASERYIEVIPEIEMPGHSRAALAAYPELSCTGLEQPVPGLWGVFEDIYCAKDETIEFMINVLKEVLTLFPSKYIHIGGDEAPKFRWDLCNDCNQLMKENGINSHELQSYFIGKIDDFLSENGRLLIGWDEILEGGLSKNAAVMSWRGEKGGIEAAKQNHYVVMSPTTYCYFDYYQSSHPSEPTAIGGYLPLEKVYQFNPTPSSLTMDEAKYIMGGQANLWTEYILSMEQLEYMTYPRALALIQSLWCTNKPDYKKFLDVYLRYHERYLEQHGVNFSRSIYYPKLKSERAEGGINIYFDGIVDTLEYKMELVQIGGAKESVKIKVNERFFIGSANQNKSRIKILLKSDYFEGDLNYDILPHLLLGAEIDLSTEPNEKYNHNGSLNLVDGIKGRIPWKGNEWLGFRETEIQIKVIEENFDIVKGVRIGTLNNKGSWIYPPEKISYYNSKDGSRWKLLKSRKAKSTVGEFDAVKMKGKYLKIIINSLEEIPEGSEGAGHRPWLFIDEIELITEE